MGVKLNILNAMLASIGSSAIVTETGTNPNLLLAQPILDRKNLTVQAKGHWFNTDWGLELSPTADGEFIVPQNTLKAQPSDPSEKYVRRGVRMYDPVNHTYNISDLDKMTLDVVINLLCRLLIGRSYIQINMHLIFSQSIKALLRKPDVSEIF